MRLLGRKIVLLSRSGNVDSMLDLIRQNPDGKDPQLYAYVYKMFVDNDHRQEGQAIIIEAGELFSQDVVILENLAKCHCYYKRYPEAVGIMQRILHICPEDVDFLILAANIVAMNGQLEECKDKLHTAQLIATRNEDQANIDKVVAILKNLSL